MTSLDLFWRKQNCCYFYLVFFTHLERAIICLPTHLSNFESGNQ